MKVGTPMIAPVRAEIFGLDVLASWFGNRGDRERLEKELVSYFGVKRVLLTDSGRAALYHLLKSLPQKKVYLPAFNCWAVAEAVAYAGKEQVFVDISLADYSMDISALRDILVPNSIIVATHQFGFPCDLVAIREVAVERNCFVIEDNAAAFGAEIDGKKTGSFTEAGILSFDFGKTLVSGKGGAILFNDESLYRKVLDGYGQAVRPPGVWRGVKHMLLGLAYAYATHPKIYPLTYALVKKIRGSYRSAPRCNLTDNRDYSVDFDDRRAKLARLNLQRLGRTIERRREIANAFMNDPLLHEQLIFPRVQEGSRPVPIKLPVRPRGLSRESLYARCKAGGVDLQYLFPYHYLGDRAAESNSRAVMETGMVLPVYSSLKDPDLVQVRSALLAGTKGSSAGRDQISPAHIERRKFSFLALVYYWLDTGAYLASKEPVALLRTHEQLPKHQYHLKFCYKTFLVDLSRSKEEIFSSFDATGARYKIRKAGRSGVKVREAATAAEKLRFYDFYQAFVEDPRRKNKILVLQNNELETLRIFYALSADGEYLGGIGLLPSPDGRILLYKYAATLHRFCENELLLWEAIQQAKADGFALFDMSWMTIPEDKASDMYRLYQFKRKFGGELVDFFTYVKFGGALAVLAGPFDLILNRFFDGDINKFALFLKKLKIFR